MSTSAIGNLTNRGIELLNQAVESATKYHLMGSDGADGSISSFYNANIETSYFDSAGLLTFSVNIPTEDFGKYLREVRLLNANNEVLVSCSTVKIELSGKIGGSLVIKVAITGEPGQIVFSEAYGLTRGQYDLLQWQTVTLFANQLTAITNNTNYQLKGVLNT